MDVSGYQAEAIKMLPGKVSACFEVALSRSNALLPSACNISTAVPVMLTRLVMLWTGSASHRCWLLFSVPVTLREAFTAEEAG